MRGEESEGVFPTQTITGSEENEFWCILSLKNPCDDNKFSIFDTFICRVTTFQTTRNSPTFPVEARKDYPVSSIYRYGQQFILMKNRVRPDSQLFNSWGCNSWGKGMRCPPPQATRESGELLVSSPAGSGAEPRPKNEFWSI